MKFSTAQEVKNIEALRALGFNMDKNHFDSIIIRTEHQAIQPNRDYWKQSKESFCSFILGHKDNSKFTENLPNTLRAERLVSFMLLVDAMIDQLKERKELMDKLDLYASNLFSPEFPPCGNNADWSVSAWYVGVNEPNDEDGDLYLLDHEDGKYSITRRNYIGDGETEHIELIIIDLNQAHNLEDGRKMIDLLAHSGTYIVHNL